MCVAAVFGAVNIVHIGSINSGIEFQFFKRMLNPYLADNKYTMLLHGPRY